MPAACDKLPLLAPQESTITLSTASTVVQANGTTEIRATVLESSGTPVQNGTTVTFTTNLGTLSPVDARTLNGVATARFVANGQSGTAAIKAISGGAASEALDTHRRGRGCECGQSERESDESRGKRRTERYHCDCD